ncbi:isochorismate synthase DhbC [Sporosarcina sp. P29]|uniref:isochorismate synthase DhbC n=1 Tax=Sporosarcina sp. P29 TaxID=2048252 RepID=UPI000C169D9A|nr:isochorismate synthase DhbC [Sporosarcina sp. P29]PID00692.1 isochorismate synthase [Sporosarcina sp. P29]
MSKVSMSKVKSILDEYESGDFFLSSSKQTIMGKGVFSVVKETWKTKNQICSLPDRVEEAIEQAKRAGHPHPIVVGAVPFDYSEASKMIIPEEVKVSTALVKDSVQLENIPLQPYEIQHIPEPAEYMKCVNQGLDKISSGQIDKIVVSRALNFKTKEQIDVKQILKRLEHHNKQGYTFAVDISDVNTISNKETVSTNGKRILIGASPELLVSKNDSILFANPLAGSRPRCDDPIEDQRRALELLESEKDLYEHAVVVNMVKESLAPFCESMDVPEIPSLIKTEAMWHLSTEIYGTLKQAQTSSLELGMALHPTPAVCGHPTELAREAIYEIEPFNRGFFAGMVGWCDENGNGEWIVTIRCAEVEENDIRLFAGAGVVAGSIPEEELNETGAKFKTMLDAMGIEKL